MTKQKNIGLYETYIWILFSFFLTLGYSSLGNSSFIQYIIFFIRYHLYYYYLVQSI